VTAARGTPAGRDAWPVGRGRSRRGTGRTLGERGGSSRVPPRLRDQAVRGYACLIAVRRVCSTWAPAAPGRHGPPPARPPRGWATSPCRPARSAATPPAGSSASARSSPRRPACHASTSGRGIFQPLRMRTPAQALPARGLRGRDLSPV
jgi:hypothetical protein